MDTEWEPMGPSRVQSLSIPTVSYFQDKDFSLWTFLNTKEKIQTVTNQGSEGMQTQRKGSQGKKQTNMYIQFNRSLLINS